MRIIINLGYQSKLIDYNTWLNEGMGGSEYCGIKLGHKLQQKGHEVVITGGVNNTTIDGVKYLHYNSLENKEYDVAIGLNYINFIKHLENKGIKARKNYFWMHNTDYYNWYEGEEMEGYKKYFRQLDGVVGVSKYHANILKEEAVELFDYTPHEVNTYIHSIDNAIDEEDWQTHNGGYKRNKIPGRIIWTSSPDRGLQLILDNWEILKQARPDLSLAILSPPYALDWGSRDYSNLKDVEWQGARCPLDLKLELAKSEYWIYVSDYVETYCISALEMMRGGVKMLTNGTGNIQNIVGNIAKKVNTVEDIVECLIADRDNKIFSYEWMKQAQLGMEKAQQENWDIRVNEWLDLFEKRGL